MRSSTVLALVAIVALSFIPSSAWTQYPIRIYGTSRGPTNFADQQEPAQSKMNDGPIIVYGRTGCGFTKKYLMELNKANVKLVYKDINDPGADKEFTNKLLKARVLGNIRLPVIEQNGKLSQRPNLAKLIRESPRNPTKANAASAENHRLDNKNQASGKSNTIIVYGRPKCGWTKSYLKKLSDANVPFVFKDLNLRADQQELSDKRIRLGRHGNMGLPIIDIDGELYERPDLKKIIKDYSTGTPGGVKPPVNAANTENATETTDRNIYIYGRMACDATKSYMKELKTANIPYTFKSIDDDTINRHVAEKLFTGGGTIYLPVVEQYGKISMRPGLAKIMKAYYDETKQTDKLTKFRESNRSIIIYSHATCRITKQYMEDLRELDIPFAFKDIKMSRNHKEFSAKLTAAGYRGSITLPVVLIDGKIFIKPGLAKTLAQ